MVFRPWRRHGGRKVKGGNLRLNLLDNVCRPEWHGCRDPTQVCYLTRDQLAAFCQLDIANLSRAGLSWCVVLPEYQKRGIGQALMAWGLTQTDQLGLESYIEATPVGRKLYERCGYRMIARVDIDIKDDDRGEEWKRIRSQTLPSSFNCMWRPGNGLWAEEPQKTWTERLTLYEDAKPKS